MKATFFSIFFLIGLQVWCQNENSFVSLQNFAPPSPDASALGRYGEIPVGHNTGVPSINIPIFDIKSGKLSLPIGLSYHASGIKVEDIASVVGLGWSLNAGGAITRRVIGKADESSAGFLNNSTYFTRSQLEGATYQSDYGFKYNYLKNLTNGTWDPQSDMYDVNSPAFTGRFVYDLNKTLQFSGVERQIKIDNTGYGFIIVDEDGTRYNFSNSETTTTASSSDITAWYITSIVSANTADTILFHYKQAAIVRDVFTSHSFVAPVPVSFPNNPYSWEYGSINPQHQVFHSNYTYNRVLLDSITFRNGAVAFEYAADRQDPGVERLTVVVVKSGINIIKKVALIQSYFESAPDYSMPANATKRLKLNAVTIQDNNNNTSGEYSFEYNGISLPAYYRGYANGAPAIKNTPYDLWGYYNGSSGEYSIPSHFRNQFNSFLARYQYPVSSNSLSYFDSKSVDRFPNLYYSKANMLTRIKYPTGGYTDFEFENNKIYNNGDSKDYSGGLRVKKIITYDNLGDLSQKEYEYGNAGTGYSITNSVPNDFDWTTATITKSPGYSFTFAPSETYNISSNSNNAIGYHAGSPVFYSLVTEYDGTVNTNNGKIVYTYDFEPDSSSGISYLSKYWNTSTDKGWARGLPLNTQVYKNTSGNYALIKEIKNNYVSLGRKAVKTGFICEQMTTIGNSPYEYDLESYLNYPYLSYEDYFLLNYFDYADVAFSYGVKKLQSTEEIQYDGSQQITAKKEYFYNATNHLYPTTIKDFVNNGSVRTVDIKYPQDKSQIQNLTGSASAAIDLMVYQNILNTPIEQDIKKDNSLLYRNRTDFVNWQNSGTVVEQYKKQQIGGGALQTEIEFKAYDTRANPTTIAKKTSPDIALLWGYRGSMLTAQATNATYGSIAYTSFEADGKGNWDYAGSTAVEGVTGGKSYYLSTGNIERTGLNASQAYTVSYWLKNGTGSVNIGGSALMNKNGWTLYEVSISGVSGITISGSGQIDELRLFPKNAQMITYTYEPLVGITSQADANNRISYYEYDSFNRLKLIRDMDKNIIKSFDYKYQQIQY